jgi:uncharacterized protein (TIGR04255 family)
MAEKLTHFPKNIKLETSPLVEAWFTMHWKIETAQETSPFVKSTGFNLQVGKVHELIKEKFSEVESLDISQLPEQMFPHNPRYRFRPIGKKWPLLQLGTAVATVNYVDDYKWENLRKEILYLREKLQEAYSNNPLSISLLSLRYRNAIHIANSKQEKLEFMESRLNTTFKAPTHIPGDFATKNTPSDVSLSIVYDLSTPLAKGKIDIQTGNHKVEGEQIESFIVDTEIVSIENVENFQSDVAFSNWLEDAHTVAHEWFLALVEGELFEQYMSKQG